MHHNRIWDRWDDPGVAEDIDRYWSADPGGYEAIYRAILAKLVQKYLLSPVEKVIEVGCGSGLIYGALVPEVIVNSCYVGVDTSSKMIDIARKRYPMGQFIYSDAYNLNFPNKSFDVALCFEVLGHLPEIQKPVAELFRVAARLVIFTVWASLEGQTLTLTEKIRNSEFLHRLYSKDDIVSVVREAANGEPYWIETRVVSDTIWAYIVFKGQVAKDFTASQKSERILPFHGLTDLFIRRQLDVQSELEGFREKLVKAAEELKRSQAKLVEQEAELERAKSELKELEGFREKLLKAEEGLKRSQAKLVEQEAELEQGRTVLNELEVLRGSLVKAKEDYQILEQVRAKLQLSQNELEWTRRKGMSIADELDAFRHRKVVRWLNRLRGKFNAWDKISPAFQQMKDDSLIFIKKLKGYYLQPSINLQRVPFLAYPLDLNRSYLSSVLIAPILDLPPSKGILGIEIVSHENEIMAQCTIPANRINESAPTRLDFSAIQNSNQGLFGLRVFVRDIDVPIRIFEWRKYAAFGFGKLKTKAFCGFLFENLS
jgi:SAM-dependent methyltransferase